MNPIHIRSHVTCAVPAPLSSGQQLEPERLHLLPSYTKSSGDVFSLWGKEKRNRLTRMSQDFKGTFIGDGL